MLTESEIKSYTVDIPADIQKLKGEPTVAVQRGVRPSRRYACEHCGKKCRTSNKMRGTRTLCPSCETDKRHAERWLAARPNESSSGTSDE
jgi:hypothetical protein